MYYTFANPSGPSFSKTALKPSGGSWPGGVGGGSTLTSDGGILVTMGVWGPLTKTVPR